MDWATIEAVIDSGSSTPEELVRAGEAVLENWVASRGEEPTQDQKEGFRLLALHRQGAKDEPSFNACRETCRELVYHHNLLAGEGRDEDARTRDRIMMGLVARHLMLFVRGKMEVAGLGEFCCAAKPVRTKDHEIQTYDARG
jgi:hypothetical protein